MIDPGHPVMVDLKNFSELETDPSQWNVGEGKRVILLRLPKDMEASELAGLKIKYTPSSSSAPSASLVEFTRETCSDDGASKIGRVTEKFAVVRTCASGATVPVSLVLPSKGRSSRFKLTRRFDEMWTVNRRVDLSVREDSQEERPSAMDEVELEERAKHVYKTIQPTLITSTSYRPLSCANVTATTATPTTSTPVTVKRPRVM